MLELQDHAHAAHLWPTAQHGDLSLGLFNFCFDRTTGHKYLGRPLKDLAKHQLPVPVIDPVTACGEVKVHMRFAGSNFCSFY